MASTSVQLTFAPRAAARPTRRAVAAAASSPAHAAVAAALGLLLITEQPAMAKVLVGSGDAEAKALAASLQARPVSSPAVSSVPLRLFLAGCRVWVQSAEFCHR